MREGGSGLFARVGGQVVGQRERRGGGNDGEEQRVQKFGVHDWILLKKFERKFFAVSNRSSTERIVTIAKHEAQLNTADGLRPGCAAHADRCCSPWRAQFESGCVCVEQRRDAV